MLKRMTYSAAADNSPATGMAIVKVVPKPDARLDIEVSTMAQQNVLHDGKTQPGAAARAAFLLADAVEAFGEPWQVLFGNAAAIIAHRQ
jgi:hypothetical protein